MGYIMCYRIVKLAMLHFHKGNYIFRCRFLYCDETQLTEEVVLPTLYAAKKYMIPALVEKCILYLEHNLSPDNVCLIYEQVMLQHLREYN